MATLRNNPVSNFLMGPEPAHQPGVGGPITNPAADKAKAELDLVHKTMQDWAAAGPNAPGADKVIPQLQAREAAAQQAYDAALVEARQRLTKDPTTGMYYDPTTGTSYTDAAGQNVVTDPNVAQQAAINFARSQHYQEQVQETQQEQGNLARLLGQVIQGQGPSLAGEQAQSNLDSIAADQRSQAAGVSGAAAPLANMVSMRNTGAAQIGATNAATMARAGEAIQARGALSQLLGQMQQTNVTGATDFASLANGGQLANQQIDAGTDQANQANNLKFLTGVTGLAGGALSGGATK